MGTDSEELRHLQSFGNSHAMPSDHIAYQDASIDEYMPSRAQDPAAGHRDNNDNLFDNSPIENKRWVLITRRFLRHTKHR